MPEPPLAGIEAKLQRAGEHVERLQADVRQFLEREPYRVTVDFEPEIDWHIAKTRIVEQPPLSLSVIFGEFAYECISALNHAVWQLAARKRGRIKVEAIKDEIQFPVALSPESFKRKGLIKLCHVSQAAVAIIEELQPYNRWNRLQGAEHPLALLKAAADADKHRVLAPSWGSVALRNLEWVLDPGPGDPVREVVGRFIVSRDATLDDGTKAMGIRFDVANDQAKVRMEGDLAPEIALGAGEYMVSLLDIQHLALFMNRCLDRLGTLFQ